MRTRDETTLFHEGLLQHTLPSKKQTPDAVSLAARMRPTPVTTPYTYLHHTINERSSASTNRFIASEDRQVHGIFLRFAMLFSYLPGKNFHEK